MTLEELIDIVDACVQHKNFKLNYRLQRDGRLHTFLSVFGHPENLLNFLRDVKESEPMELTEQKERKPE